METLQELAALVQLYEKHKHESLCIDIETTHFNGNIAVLGAFQPAEGIITTTQLVRGKNLNHVEVRRLFRGVKLLVTFNGSNHDITKIREAYPRVIDDIPHLDLHLIARYMGYEVGLKFLENHFEIFRDEPYKFWRRKAIKLWKGYQDGNPKSLHALLKYNANDCVNLYPLAQQLTKMLWKKWVTQRVLQW